MLGLLKLIRLVRMYLEGTREVNYDISSQLLHLVRQAHLGEEFHTMWDIEVSSEMRAALRKPLTPQQIQLLDARKACGAGVSVSGYVLSHRQKDGELSGVVCISVDVHDPEGICSCRYENVKLRVTVSHAGRMADLSSRWFVSSVEQI